MTKQNELSPEQAYLEMVAALRAGRAETVTMKLFKDNGKYKGDVFASVNGRRFHIQRGVEVEMPYAIAQVIKASEKQDEKAARLVSRLSGEARFA